MKLEISKELQKKLTNECFTVEYLKSGDIIHHKSFKYEFMLLWYNSESKWALCNTKTFDIEVLINTNDLLNFLEKCDFVNNDWVIYNP